MHMGLLIDLVVSFELQKPTVAIIFGWKKHVCLSSYIFSQGKPQENEEHQASTEAWALSQQKNLEEVKLHLSLEEKKQLM